MDLDNVSQLSPDRLVVIGSAAVRRDHGHVNVMLVDGSSGRISGNTRPRDNGFDEPGGYWARVAAFQGRGSGKTKVLQLVPRPLASGPDGYTPPRVRTRNGCSSSANGWRSSALPTAGPVARPKT